jgi:alpha-ketoglutarate-dependent taurine dioxygenase
MPNFHVKPLHATFGAIVANIQLAELHERNFDALYRVWLDYALLIFPGQNLSAEAQLEFPIETVTNLDATGAPRDDPDDEVMKVLRSNEGWHCDSTYMPIPKYAVFCVQAHAEPRRWHRRGSACARATMY